jgi:hypothetical protein
MDKIICNMMEGVEVTPEEREAVATELMARLVNGERGDDVPILMELFGCDYDAACDAVVDGDKEIAKSLLNAALCAVSAPDRNSSPTFNM